MELSICISTWNRYGDLLCIIDSILRQDYICNGDDWEIIVVDNCSTDNTVKYLQSLKHRLGDKLTYKVMDHSKYTAMQTLNLSFKMASGKYILVMDDDAYFKDTASLGKMIYDIINCNNAAIVGVSIFDCNNNKQFKLDVHSSVKYFDCIDDKEQFKLDGSLIEYFDFKGACAIFNNEILRQIGYYDESFKLYMNELDLSCRCIANGYMVYNDPAIEVIHRGVVKIGDPYRYLHNYHEVLYRYFNKFNAIKLMMLNYIIVGYYSKNICSNFILTLQYIIKTIFRVGSYNTIPLKWQYMLVDKTINSILEFVWKR